MGDSMSRPSDVVVAHIFCEHGFDKPHTFCPACNGEPHDPVEEHCEGGAEVWLVSGVRVDPCTTCDGQPSRRKKGGDFDDSGRCNSCHPRGWTPRPGTEVLWFCKVTGSAVELPVWDNPCESTAYADDDHSECGNAFVTRFGDTSVGELT